MKLPHLIENKYSWVIESNDLKCSKAILIVPMVLHICFVITSIYSLLLIIIFLLFLIFHHPHIK